MEELALVAGSQVEGGFSDFDFDQVGFVLANRAQVETPGFFKDFDAALVVSCVGKHTKAFTYGSSSIEKANVPVTWAGGRMSALNLTVIPVVDAFLKKKSVVVHCNHSFHRGPLGFAMIAKVLFGCEPMDAMLQLATTRTIYYLYQKGQSHPGEELWETLQWAKKLAVAMPKSSKDMSASSAWGARSKAMAVSQEKKGQARAMAASKPRYLYRAMTVGLTEFDPPTERPPSHTGLKLACSILDAVERGSDFRSPFLHCSWDFWEARKWQSRGEGLRREKGTIVCRVSTEKLAEVAASQGVQGPIDLDRGLVSGEVVDLSTVEECRKWLLKYSSEDAVQNRLPTMNRSHACKEVAVAWRGYLMKDLWEVLDDGGKPLHFLSEGRFLHVHVTTVHVTTVLYM